MTNIQWVTKQRVISKHTSADVEVVAGTYGRDVNNERVPGVNVKFSKKITDLVVKNAEYVIAGYDEAANRIYFDFTQSHSGFALEHYTNGAAWCKFRISTCPFFADYMGTYELHLDSESGYYFIEKGLQ